MITSYCVAKHRDNNGKILGYTLVDLEGERLDIKSDDLKQAILNKHIRVDNLQLTEDNRLIDKKLDMIQVDEFNSETSRLLHDEIRYDTLNLKFMSNASIDTLIQYPESKGFKYKVIKLTGNMNLLMFGNAAVVVSNAKMILPWNCDALFMGYHCKTMDLSGLDATRVLTMNNTFAHCITDEIIFPDFSKSPISTLDSTFAMADIPVIDISNFNTKDLKLVTRLFNHCKAKKIILGNLNTHNVEDFSFMFSNCTLDNLDLSFLDMTNATNMGYMFYKSNIKKLILPTKYGDRVETVNDMFNGSTLGSIDISNLNIKGNCIVRDIFSKCNISSVKLSHKQTRLVKEARNNSINTYFIDTEPPRKNFGWLDKILELK